MAEYIYAMGKDELEKLSDAMKAPLCPVTKIDEEGNEQEKALQKQMQADEMAGLVKGVDDKMKKLAKEREIHGILFKAGTPVDIPDGHPLTLSEPGKKSKLAVLVGSGVLRPAKGGAKA